MIRAAPGPRRFPPAGSMQFCGRGAQFEHLAGDDDLPFVALQLAEKTNHFRQRLWIRVVGIVDDVKPFVKPDDLAALLLRSYFCDRGTNVLPGDSV